jgi:hypothetical protein
VVMTKRGARSSSRLIKPGEEFRSQRGLFFFWMKFGPVMLLD